MTPDSAAPVIDAPTAEEHLRIQRRTLAVLSLTLLVGGIGVAMGLTVGTLFAATISGSDAIGGLAGSTPVLGAGLLAVPIARIAGSAGRRPALAVAYGGGALGAGTCAVALALEWWPLLLGGLILFGGGSAAGYAARYSALDLAPAGRAASHLSIVVWATTVGSVAGPNLAGPAQRLSELAGFPAMSGPFLLSTVAFGLATLGLLAGLRPDPLRVARAAAAAEAAGSAVPGVGEGSRRPRPALSDGWRVIRASRPARVAVAAMVISHTLMVALMSMTPVHLGHGGVGLTVIGVVISVHILGMYALSPLVGWLADRFGRTRVLVAGLVQLVAAMLVAGTAAPQAHGQVMAGLFLLGTGWSCGLVAGSTLLTQSVSAADRPTVQGFSDLLMQGSAALAGVLAGAVVALGSYGLLAMLLAVTALPPLVLILRPRRGGAAGAPAAPAG